MRHKALIALLFAATVADASEQFRSKECRCSFEVPGGWVVVSNPEAKIRPTRLTYPEKYAPCAFGLRPKIWPPLEDGRETELDFGDFAITIHVTRQRFRDAARDAFFERVDALRKEREQPGFAPQKKPTDWFLYGRQGLLSEATWIRSPHWFGLSGVATVGYYGKRGSGRGYVGLGEAPRAVLSTGYWRTAIFTVDNPSSEKEFGAVVTSFRFE